VRNLTDESKRVGPAYVKESEGSARLSPIRMRRLKFLPTAIAAIAALLIRHHRSAGAATPRPFSEVSRVRPSAIRPITPVMRAAARSGRVALTVSR
jgi:hypothetical protein